MRYFGKTVRKFPKINLAFSKTKKYNIYIPDIKRFSLSERDTLNNDRL